MYPYALGEAPVTQPQPDANSVTEEPYKLVWNQTLQNGDSFNDLRQTIDWDGDFIVTDVYGTSTGAYSIQFFNGANRAMSSAQMSNANAVGTAQFPLPYGGVRYPAGGQIRIAITNQLAGVNTVQLVFSGIKLRKFGR